ncbi:MAG: HAMP domain-containing protein [Elusimicrobia bacterium]|nr:HAMP domain-containing protein [Elusimicrobiota bacterium]
MKLRNQFTLFSALLVLLSVVGVTSFLYYTEKKVLLKEMESKERATVKQLAQIGREALIVKDDLLLLNYVNLIKKTTPAVVYAFIEDAGGKILAHTDPMRIDEKDVSAGAPLALKSEDILKQNFFEEISGAVERIEILDFSKPIYLGKNKAAVARVGFSKEELRKIVTDSLSKTRTRIYGIGLINMLIGCVVAFLLAAAISRPIKILSDGAAEIGKGNFEHELHIKRKDELGQLAATFNEMARRLKELDEMKRDFVSSVTHELRSPLAAIDSYINMMIKQLELQSKKGDGGKSDFPPSPFLIWEDNFARIKKNTVRLSKFIDDLLDVSKIESGKLDVCQENIEYEPVISDMVELFTPKAAEQGIDLSFEMEKDLPFVFGDANRLKQVITNLVGNALKFTPQGGKIKIKAYLDKTNGSKMVETAVSDTGFGIPEDKVEKIFSKFEQVKEHRDKVKGQKGTGLGLAIAKAIVEMHSGKIWIKSKVNKGTTFHFTIPAVEKEEYQDGERSRTPKKEDDNGAKNIAC